MSRSARWTLGSFAALFAAILALSERTAASKAPLVNYLVVGFCVLIAVACFGQSWRGAAIRAIGSMVFIATVVYVVYEQLKEPKKPYVGRSQPHWLNAIRALVQFGLPGLYVALRGEYPKWGTGAAVFRGGSESSDRETTHLSNTAEK